MQAKRSRTDWIRGVLAEFESPLYRYAVRLLGEPERARDAVQETFLAVCQADRSRIEPHLAAWLFRVCRNRALDMRRKETRVQPLTEENANLASPEPGPSAALEAQEGTGQVLALVSDLPENQREVIYLRFGAGLSYKEIGDVTGNSVSNVGVLIHCGVKKLRERLGPSAAQAGRTAEPERTMATGPVAVRSGR